MRQHLFKRPVTITLSNHPAHPLVEGPLAWENGAGLVEAESGVDSSWDEYASVSRRTEAALHGAVASVVQNGSRLLSIEPDGDAAMDAAMNGVGMQAKGVEEDAQGAVPGMEGAASSTGNGVKLSFEGL